MKARLPQGVGKGAPSNMNQVIKQAQKMQEDMEVVRAELEEKIYETTVGGGVVCVKANGKKEIVELKIKPEVVDPEDIGMLEDLVISAVNEIIRVIEEESNDKLGKLTGGLNIPGLF